MFRLLAGWAVASILSGCTLAFAGNYSAVRQVEIKNTAYVETLSRFNSASPQLRISPKPLVTKSAAGATLIIQADADIADDWQQPSDFHTVEVGTALAWLTKLSGHAEKEIEVILTLADGAKRIDEKKRHESTQAAIVDLFLPVHQSSSGTRSAAIRNALATSIHEASHALSVLNNTGLSRIDEEYRATLTESCFLVDTLHAGDVLHFGREGNTQRHYGLLALGQSKKAAAQVMNDLSAIAGVESVSFSNVKAISSLQRFCTTYFQPKLHLNSRRQY